MPLFAILWTAALLFTLVRYSSAYPPSLVLAYALPAVAIAVLLSWRRLQLRALLQEHRVLFGAAALLAVLAFAAQLTAADGFVQDFERVIAQPALLLCLPPLAFFLVNEPRLVRWIGVAACALALWHLVALPVEALSGMRMSWYRTALIERDAGPLHFQAAGLAQQAYFFAGLMLPLFYVAWGWVWGRLDASRHAGQRAALLVLLAAWVLAVACVQSRSALAGAAAASAVLGIASLPSHWRKAAAIAVAAALTALALLYFALFSQNKSSAGLRWEYAWLYLHESFDGLRLFTGHGMSAYPPATMKLADYPISHSHNDLVQVLYSWGLPALAAYLVFLGALVRRVGRLAAAGVWWPLAALLALAPNMVTDLGVQHYEKAAFLVLLAALCIAQQRAQDTGGS